MKENTAVTCISDTGLIRNQTIRIRKYWNSLCNSYVLYKAQVKVQGGKMQIYYVIHLELDQEDCEEGSVHAWTQDTGWM